MFGQSLLSAFGIACTTDTDQLFGTNPNSIAYYKMSDATDQLGNYNGTATNVNFNTEGKFGFAGSFNGSSSYITTSNPLGTGNVAYSISAWIKLTASSHTGGIYIIWDGGTSAGTYLFFKVEAGKISIGNYGASVTSANTLAVNQWVHVAVTRDTSNNVVLYVNGSSDTTGTLTLNLGNNNPKIGALNTSVQNFNGSIDQVRIYDSALSAANVSTLYKEVECEPAAINALANFNTVLYTGNASTNQISTVGFAPGFTWIKARNTTTSPEAHDVVRGEPSRLWVDNNYAASTAYNGFVELTPNGFDLNNVGNGGNVNRNYNYVAWNWKAGGTAVSNTDGTITSQVSANVDAGFSIVKYEGTGGVATVGHGLSSAPEMYIVKSIEHSASWYTYHIGLDSSAPQDYNVRLNETAARQDSASYWNDTAPTSSVYTIGTTTGVSKSSTDFITYCFTSIPGYSKIGSYVGTAAAGNFQYTGFQPSWLMVKCSSASGRDWVIFDDKRISGSSYYELYPNTAGTENGPYPDVTLNSTGFTLGTNASFSNGSGDTYIYLAIA